MISQTNPKNEAGSLALLQQIKDRAIKPKSLAPQQRRLLVSMLINEGQSSAEIAQLLEVSDRTIERDRQALRNEGSLQQDPALVSEVAGQLQAQGELSIQRILKIARDKNTSHSVKVEAYHRCFEIACRYSERLQSLGFLPTATTKVEAKLSRGIDEIPSFDVIEAEIARLEKLAYDGSDSKNQILALTGEIKRAKLAGQVTTIKENLEFEGAENDKAD